MKAKNHKQKPNQITVNDTDVQPSSPPKQSDYYGQWSLVIFLVAFGMIFRVFLTRAEILFILSAWALGVTVGIIGIFKARDTSYRPSISRIALMLNLIFLVFGAFYVAMFEIGILD